MLIYVKHKLPQPLNWGSRFTRKKVRSTLRFSHLRKHFSFSSHFNQDLFKRIEQEMLNAVTHPLLVFLGTPPSLVHAFDKINYVTEWTRFCNHLYSTGKFTIHERDFELAGWIARKSYTLWTGNHYYVYFPILPSYSCSFLSFYIFFFFSTLAFFFFAYTFLFGWKIYYRHSIPTLRLQKRQRKKRNCRLLVHFRLGCKFVCTQKIHLQKSDSELILYGGKYFKCRRVRRFCTN